MQIYVAIQYTQIIFPIILNLRDALKLWNNQYSTYWETKPGSNWTMKPQILKGNKNAYSHIWKYQMLETQFGAVNPQQFFLNEDLSKKMYVKS